jgi:microcystin-dependent protein
MAQPYVGEIRMFAGNFAPAGWFFCDGSLISIAEYETLFNLIGTTYGGDGQSTFALPDLRGRVPIHQGSTGSNNYAIGEMAGVETVTLTTSQIPLHTHTMLANSTAASSANPDNNVYAATSGFDAYIAAPDGGTMPAGTVGSAGGSQPHTNMQPYLCMNFIISMFGIYPTPF